MKRPGISLLEVTVAMVVVAVVSLGFIGFQGAMVKSGQKEKDRTFAMQKAIQMMEELKAKVAEDATTVLDDYNDGDTTYRYELTTEKVSPASPLSDNVPVPINSYRYVRQIDVRPLPRDKGARQVTIRVYLSNRTKTATRALDRGQPLPALATLTNIFKTPPVIVAPSQMYDMYSLRMDGIVPGKWKRGVSSYSNPSWYSGQQSTAIGYLKGANPGLEIKRTYIDLPAYGRDPWYSPLYNSSGTYDFQDGTGFGHADTNRIPLNKVYYLLGNRGGGGSSWETFRNGPFRKTHTRAGATSEGNGDYKPNDYGVDPLTTAHTHGSYRPIADQFNHAMRYVEEWEKLNANNAKTLRWLLDSLLEKRKRNVIISNMHGEVFPMIPMRNYSDPAKVPYDSITSRVASNWGVVPASSDEAREGAKARLVTHPHKLEYGMADTVQLRVYPYVSDNREKKPKNIEPPSAYRRGIIVLRGVANNLADAVSGADPEHQIQIQVMDFYRDDSHKHFFTGDCDERRYRRVLVWPPSHPSHMGGMQSNYIESVTTVTSAANGYQAGDVVIKLKNIPYVHEQFRNQHDPPTCWANKRDQRYGLRDDTHLYGLHYFPDPALPLLDQYRSESDKEDPRNTARVFVTFKLKQPQRVEVQTTIGGDDDLRKHKRPNLSRTWAWVGDPAPESERYQFLGDPRHNPYADVRAAKRYNRHFASLTTDAYDVGAGESWNRFDDTTNGWGGDTTDGRHEADVPAYLGLWRKALMDSNSMFAQATGNGFNIVALGGEYGGDTWQSKVDHSTQPFDGDDDLDDFDTWKEPTVVVHKDNKEDEWFSIPWLGEIWPMERWEDWRDTGNLPSSRYRHVEWDDVKGYEEHVPDFNHSRYVDHWGPLGFFYADTDFEYKEDWRIAEPTSDNGKALDANLNAKLNPWLDVLYGFSLNGSVSSRPPDDDRFTRAKLEPGLKNGSPEYYKSSDGRAAIMPFVLRGSGADVAYYLFFSPPNHWTARSGNNDPYSMQRVYHAAIIQGFMDMAGFQFAGPANKPAEARIKLLPRIKIIAPEDDALIEDSSVTIEWEPEWTRWDTNRYSEQYANYTTGHSPQVVYQLKYSEDQGKSWRFMDNKAGTKVDASAVFVPGRERSGTTFTWDMSGLKNGQKQVRIEAYRHDPTAPGTYEQDHHAFTQFSINLAR